MKNALDVSTAEVLALRESTGEGLYASATALKAQRARDVVHAEHHAGRVSADLAEVLLWLIDGRA